MLPAACTRGLCDGPFFIQNLFMGKQLKRGLLMAGIPAIKVRDMLAGLRGYSFDAGTVAMRLKLRPLDAEALFALMLKRRLVRLDQLSPRGWYKLTPAGVRFTLMRAFKPVARGKAGELLTQAVAACETLNADGNQPFYIRSLRVFGSFLGDKPQVGDLDLAVELAARDQGLVGREWMEWNLAYGYAKGKAQFLAVLSAAELAARSCIKNRSRYVSIHTLDELKRLGTPSREVFKAKKVAKPLPLK